MMMNMNDDWINDWIINEWWMINMMNEINNKWW